MRSFIVVCGVGALAFFAAGLIAQDAAPKKNAAKKRAPNPALAAIEETPGLPRVLLIGDSISMGYTVAVRELLKGKANVLRPPTNCGPTTNGLANLDQWLGAKKWDVIHFNWGLHDLKFVDATGKLSDTTGAGTRPQVSLEQYEKNLRELAGSMKKTGATLIWCATTPVPEGSAGRIAEDAVKYNEVAARVMCELIVVTNDLHAFALPRLAEIQLPKNVHFTPQGSKVLAEEVARVIEKALKPTN